MIEETEQDFELNYDLPIDCNLDLDDTIISLSEIHLYIRKLIYKGKAGKIELRILHSKLLQEINKLEYKTSKKNKCFT